MVRIRAASGCHCSFIREDGFYISVMQHPFLRFFKSAMLKCPLLVPASLRMCLIITLEEITLPLNINMVWIVRSHFVKKNEVKCIRVLMEHRTEARRRVVK